MKNNLKSIEFCFETGDGVTLRSTLFNQFEVNNRTISFRIASENNITYHDEWSGQNVLFDKLLNNDVTQIFIHYEDKVKVKYLADYEDIYGRVIDYMNTYIDNEYLVCTIKVVTL